MTIQIESAAEIAISCPMVGRATPTIVASITESDTPHATAKIAPMRRGIGTPSEGMCGIWVIERQRYEKSEARQSDFGGYYMG